MHFIALCAVKLALAILRREPNAFSQGLAHLLCGVVAAIATNNPAAAADADDACTILACAHPWDDGVARCKVCGDFGGTKLVNGVVLCGAHANDVTL